MNRYRVTIRQDVPRIELRGYVDDGETIILIADALRTALPSTMLIASPAPDDYDPFGES